MSMTFIRPLDDQLKRLGALGHEGPVVMVNLLKFKPAGGAQSYAAYAKFTTAYITETLGGRILYHGKGLMPLIGPEEWDAVILVEYPSIAAFIRMTKDEGYRAVVAHRNEALLDSRLYVAAAKAPRRTDGSF
jgi:uncharacterized protein (DUF1330 family)